MAYIKRSIFETTIEHSSKINDIISYNPGRNFSQQRENTTFYHFSLGFLLMLAVLGFKNWVTYCIPILPSYTLVLFFLKWSIGDLQSFRCTSKWLSYTHISILFPCLVMIPNFLFFQLINSFYLEHSYNIVMVLSHSRLLQDIEYSSICCRVGACCFYFFF